jgi:hypothetical protein
MNPSQRAGGAVLEVVGTVEQHLLRLNPDLAGEPFEEGRKGGGVSRWGQ